jgi:hypothetical protein
VEYVGCGCHVYRCCCLYSCIYHEGLRLIVDIIPTLPSFSLWFCQRPARQSQT